MAAVVDPIIKPGDFAVSVLGHNKLDTPIFNDLNSWHHNYFKKLSEEQKEKQVVEMPLKPELLYGQAIRYVDAGVKQLTSQLHKKRSEKPGNTMYTRFSGTFSNSHLNSPMVSLSESY